MKARKDECFACTVPPNTPPKFAFLSGYCFGGAPDERFSETRALCRDCWLELTVLSLKILEQRTVEGGPLK